MLKTPSLLLLIALLTASLARHDSPADTNNVDSPPSSPSPSRSPSSYPSISPSKSPTTSPTFSPTFVPTFVPSEAPSTSPSSFPKDILSLSKTPVPVPTEAPKENGNPEDSCMLDSDSGFGEKNGDGVGSSITSDFVEVIFHYELEYTENITDPKDLLPSLETNLANAIIRQAFPECIRSNHRRDRHLRRRLHIDRLSRSSSGESFFQNNPLSWLSSAPKDLILQDLQCKSGQDPCVVVAGAFNASVSRNTEVSTEIEVSSSDDDIPSKEQIKLKLVQLVESEINTSRLAKSTFGVKSVRLVDIAQIHDMSNNGDSEVFVDSSWRLSLYLGVSVVIASMIGMVGVGSLIKKCRDRGIEERHHPLENMRGTQLDRNALKDYDESSTLVSNEESLWNRGWDNVTHVYDTAVEVCMEKLDLNRQKSF